MNIQKDLLERQKKIYLALPEFVIGVSHLVGSKLWHQNFDDVDEN